jgi:alkyl hydroperoxide reductase subunit D
MNKEKTALLELLGLPADYSSESLAILEEGNSPYLRDLRLNIQSRLDCETLTAKEVALLGVATAANENNTVLLESFRLKSQDAGATAAEIAEAIACASWLSTNNVLYRFKHFAANEKYDKMPARLRMNIMRNPVAGKELFELMSVATSAINGCELCVDSHEKALVKLGVSEERIFDAIRLVSALAGLCKIIY